MVGGRLFVCHTRHIIYSGAFYTGGDHVSSSTRIIANNNVCMFRGTFAGFASLILRFEATRSCSNSEIWHEHEIHDSLQLTVELRAVFQNREMKP